MKLTPVLLAAGFTKTTFLHEKAVCFIPRFVLGLGAEFSDSMRRP